MDIEQLKLIIDLARDAGEGAFWIAVLWICQAYFQTLVNAVVLSVVVICLYKLINAIRTSLSFAVKVQNTLDYFDLESSNEVQKVINWIAKHHKDDPFQVGYR